MPGIHKFALKRQSGIAPATAGALPERTNDAARKTTDPIAAVMDEASDDIPRLLTPKAVSEMLSVAERTLERWRITGEGPRFVKLSRSSVRYLPEDVTTFVADRLRANTAQ